MTTQEKIESKGYTIEHYTGKDFTRVIAVQGGLHIPAVTMAELWKKVQFRDFEFKKIGVNWKTEFMEVEGKYKGEWYIIGFDSIGNRYDGFARIHSSRNIEILEHERNYVLVCWFVDVYINEEGYMRDKYEYLRKDCGCQRVFDNVKEAKDFLRAERNIDYTDEELEDFFNFEYVIATETEAD